MTPPTLVVVSGLPAAGKSTTGRLLSRGLGLPLLDRDVILEALFDSLGSATAEKRARLGRAGDEVLLALAVEARSAVLASWWSRGLAPERLRAITPLLVEVHCDCPVELAVERVERRLRRTRPEEVAEAVDRVRGSHRGPLGVGRVLVRVDTAAPVDGAALVAEVRAALASFDALDPEPA